MNSEKSIFLTEEQKIKKRLETTHTERFRLLMGLIRLDRKLKQARIIHSKS